MILYDKNNILIRSAEIEDINSLKTTMRIYEAQEVYASHCHTPEEALKHSFSISDEKFTLIYNGEVMAMFGVSLDPLSENGSIWMLTSEKIESIWFRFLKLSRNVIKTLSAVHPILYNYVDQRHTLAVDWLKWCGATIFEAKPYGKMGLPFHYFELRGETNV